MQRHQGGLYAASKQSQVTRRVIQKRFKKRHQTSKSIRKLYQKAPQDLTKQRNTSEGPFVEVFTFLPVCQATTLRRRNQPIHWQCSGHGSCRIPGRVMVFSWFSGALLVSFRWFSGGSQVVCRCFSHAFLVVIIIFCSISSRSCEEGRSLLVAEEQTRKQDRERSVGVSHKGLKMLLQGVSPTHQRGKTSKNFKSFH